MNLEVSTRTDIGNSRERNEDFYGTHSELDFVVIADGVGGEAYGEVASKKAVEWLLINIKSYLEITDRFEMLDSLLKKCNEYILDLKKNNYELSSMATTLSCAYIENQKVYVGHVGDSRVYKMNSEKIICLTMDHNIKNYLESKKISKEDLPAGYRESALLNFIGGSYIDVEKHCAEIAVDDVILLATDGLFSEVSDEIILRTVDSFKNNLKKASIQLVEKALSNRGRDNITMILLRRKPQDLWSRLKYLLKA